MFFWLFCDMFWSATDCSCRALHRLVFPWSSRTSSGVLTTTLCWCGESSLKLPPNTQRVGRNDPSPLIERCLVSRLTRIADPCSRLLLRCSVWWLDTCNDRRKQAPPSTLDSGKSSFCSKCSSGSLWLPWVLVWFPYYFWVFPSLRHSTLWECVWELHLGFWKARGTCLHRFPPAKRLLCWGDRTILSFWRTKRRSLRSMLDPKLWSFWLDGSLLVCRTHGSPTARTETSRNPSL